MDATAPFYLKLETIASNETPQDAIDHLIAISRRIGLAVQANISGVTVTVYPSATPTRAKLELTDALGKRDKTYIIIS